ncbi:MAG TPA: hypothetical protein DGB32_08415 [Dehalococcoidia bacterium]|nr:hypothetical protein [Dehalococcoidia bacterium]
MVDGGHVEAAGVIGSGKVYPGGRGHVSVLKNLVVDLTWRQFTYTEASSRDSITLRPIEEILCERIAESEF